MRTIIIEEDRFVEILEALKAREEEMQKDVYTGDPHEDSIRKDAIRQAHRSFHYHLVGWMQSHGARCTRV